jgi:hypothetical protein
MYVDQEKATQVSVQYLLYDSNNQNSDTSDLKLSKLLFQRKLYYMSCDTFL